MCSHSFFYSEYATIICRICGMERQCCIPPSAGYTENQPLELGYSRFNRMTGLLNQLFNPTLYGTPNYRVLSEAKKQRFDDGKALLVWLSKLNIKNKRYFHAHFYFAASQPTYKMPPPPNKQIIREILTIFSKIDYRFDNSKHPFKSFFSYNWMVRRFLKDFDLGIYLQFVKDIKCKKRGKLYDMMWEYFTTPDSVVKGPGGVPGSRIPLDVFLGDAYSSHQALRFASDQLVENRPSSWGGLT